jgi:hypothetical protein
MQAVRGLNNHAAIATGMAKRGERPRFPVSVAPIIMNVPHKRNVRKKMPRRMGLDKEGSERKKYDNLC